MTYRLGIDIGTNSIGWCAHRLGESGNPTSILATGVRIFTDGREARTGASLAVDRRAARAARRRRDRYLRRRDVLMGELVKAGLMPADGADRKALEAHDPFELRARALDQALPLPQIGRLLFHLNQRRGFKSNRKADRGNRDDDTGKIRVGIDRLHKAMEEADARTYGEFLFKRLREAKSVRTRLRPEPGEDAKGDGYDFYPDRALLEDEFDQIWRAQAAHYPDILTDALRDRLRYVVFGQRPLKPPEVGKCTLLPNEKRLTKAHPLFQLRRLYEEVNALEIVLPGEPGRKLTLEQRDLLIARIKGKRQVAFESLRKALKLPPEARFNKETENRDKLLGDEIGAALADKKCFGNAWYHLDWTSQWEVVRRLTESEDDAPLLAWLKEAYKLADEAAVKVAAVHLPIGYGRFGQTATEAILRELKAEVIPYSEAVGRAPELGHHSDFRTGEVWNELPYYGEILDREIPPGSGDPDDPEDVRLGRITNPTVHIGLNQLRRVVNALMRQHGRPAEIVVELARDLKLNERQKADVNRSIKSNTEAAIKRSEKLGGLNQRDTGANRLLMRLWEELNPANPLDRRCVYCGRQISVESLFSGAIDIDHILPFSETLDDTPANRIVAHTECNRRKRNQDPWTAFQNADNWLEIAELAARLPANKRWRFRPDAMERFETQGGFLARQLVDTQYLSRLARSYLAALYPETGAAPVWVVPGRLTEMLRRHWGLNALLPDHNVADATKEKNRLDHRHHAIDAAVIGVTDRSLLQRISREAGVRESQQLDDVIGSVSPPWESFREELRAHLDRMVVSHRPDHGKISFAGRSRGRDRTAGRLHNDTAYGLTGAADDKGNSVVVHRVPLTSLKSEKDIFRVRDAALRDALWGVTRGLSGKEFQQALIEFSRNDRTFGGIRRVRVTEPLAVIPIRDRSGRPYKGFKGDSNYRYDVWRLPDGTWRAEVVSMFDAHREGWLSPIKDAFPMARKVLRLHQGDLVAHEVSAGGLAISRVVKFDRNGRITLVAHNEAGDLKKRDTEPSDVDPFKYYSPTVGGLRRIKARQVRIDELGRVCDPGPRE